MSKDVFELFSLDGDIFVPCLEGGLGRILLIEPMDDI